jgi:hypothetical protein
MKCIAPPKKNKIPNCFAFIPKAKLKFGEGNAKLSKAIATFSLPAGHSCPFAKECLSKADRITGKIIDGKHCKFRCFSASAENTYKNVREARWFNFDLMREAGEIEKMANLIQRSLPFGISIIRIHVSGDYYNEKYFLAWLNVSLNNPAVIFYAYTKALPLWTKYKEYIPSNFRLTASKGGTCDNLIKTNKLKYAEVVFSTEEARRKGLELDHDDSHAISSKKSFGLLLHGIQPAGTEAAMALTQLKQQGIFGYNKNNLRIDKSIQLFVPIK